MTRLDWDTSWLLVAGVVARRSRCVRYQTGTVIVDRRNRIVATGYIGPAAGLVGPEAGYLSRSHETCAGFCERGRSGPTDETRLSYSDCTSIHSEINALLVCDRRDREGGTLYVTSIPCWTCAKAIANSGVARVVVVDTRAEHGYRDPGASLAHLRDSGLRVDVVEPSAVLLLQDVEATPPQRREVTDRHDSVDCRRRHLIPRAAISENPCGDHLPRSCRCKCHVVPHPFTDDATLVDRCTTCEGRFPHDHEIHREPGGP